MKSTLEDIHKQVKELCLQIEEKIRELGDVDILTYRSNPQIKELRRKICEVFKKYPTCLAQLILSEELTCPNLKS